MTPVPLFCKNKIGSGTYCTDRLPKSAAEITTNITKNHKQDKGQTQTQTKKHHKGLQAITTVSFTIVVPIPTAFLLPLLLLLGGGKDSVFPTLPLPLPAALQELLADTPGVGRCLHVDRAVMSGQAEQREEMLRSAEQQLPFGWSLQLHFQPIP